MVARVLGFGKTITFSQRSPNFWLEYTLPIVRSIVTVRRPIEAKRYSTFLSVTLSNLREQAILRGDALQFTEHMSHKKAATLEFRASTSQL